MADLLSDEGFNAAVDWLYSADEKIAADAWKAERAARKDFERKATEAGRIVDEQAETIADLEARLAAVTADAERLDRELDLARNEPWPQWADDIRKRLMEYGIDGGPENEWDIGELFDIWFEGAIEAETARAERAEAALAGARESALREALAEPPIGAIQNGRTYAQWIESKGNLPEDWPDFVRCFEFMAGWIEIRLALIAPSSPVPVEPLPQDVVELVIAAREAWEEMDTTSELGTALDKALGAFASRVPYADDPEIEPADGGTT